MAFTAALREAGPGLRRDEAASAAQAGEVVQLPVHGP